MVLAGLLSGIGGFLLNALVGFINLLIAAVGAVIAVVFSILPSLPSIDDAETVPTLVTGCSPTEVCISPLKDWMNFFLPLTGLLALAATFLAIYTAVLVFRVFARWLKVL